LSHRVFGSEVWEKAWASDFNPRIDFCCGSYIVDGMSDLRTNVVSARQMVMHIDFARSSLTLG
jgi:hypothetical protein